MLAGKAELVKLKRKIGVPLYPIRLSNLGTKSTSAFIFTFQKSTSNSSSRRHHTTDPHFYILLSFAQRQQTQFPKSHHRSSLLPSVLAHSTPSISIFDHQFYLRSTIQGSLIAVLIIFFCSLLGIVQKQNYKAVKNVEIVLHHREIPDSINISSFDLQSFKFLSRL
ncbi:hypothetical protein L2E82_38479 [Cichorium intybus]|uniref:Uncharacterized protein n=1 Tax=Cichorium intybus TaxID=13427 RepID=A0ACB9AGD9_CICIN|nr:hypothetical protein L2E82_38479 [Cichorium intybus]